MLTLKFFAVAGVLLGFVQTSQAAGQWPRLDRKSSDFVCTETLKYARKAFKSNNFHLFEPAPLPDDAQSVLVAPPPKLDISGGDSFDTSHGSFERYDVSDLGDKNLGSFVHFQTQPTAGWRFVVYSEAVGWRGNMYSLYRLDQTITEEEFEGFLASGELKSLPSPATLNEWRPPLILKRMDTAATWAVSVASDELWSVYPANGTKGKPTCTIRFGDRSMQFARNGKFITTIFPPAVQNLIQLLFEATGDDGPNSGTLHAVSRTKVEAAQTWRNVSIRPWAAMVSQPYNTREDVNRNLTKWGESGPNKVLLDALQTQYPKAESALAGYYAKEFRKKPREAKELARTILDLAYRSHFVFPKAH